MKLLHRGLNVMFFDIETTGFPQKDKPIDIIEVGIRFVENLGTESAREEVLSQLYSAPLGVPKFITKLTGISETMVYGQPHITEHIQAIQNRVDRADILVAHNAPFDIRCLEEVGVSFEGKEVFDTSTNSKRLFPELAKHTMSSVCNHLNIINVDAHRALDDVDAMIEVYNELTNLDLRARQLAELTRKHKKLTYTRIKNK